jgi:two-component system cell cycle sensor histidine kinase/response regulator CckA
VFGIVKQHKGYITCQSQPGKGTMFQVYLPLWEDNAETAATSASERETLEYGMGTVLLVEDDPMVRQMMQVILSHGGYRVIEAANGSEAIRMLRDCRDQVNIVVMDIMMPGKNGLETLTELQQINEDIPCIFVSGYSTTALSERGIDSCDITLLDKPVSPQKLLMEVKSKIAAGFTKRAG